VSQPRDLIVFLKNGLPWRITSRIRFSRFRDVVAKSLR